jgi:medium-chain acyl-[acyl-carrier-protein] hydrolase
MAPDARESRHAKVKVYCLPHAGGSASTYFRWTLQQQYPELDFTPVELPGRGSRLREPTLVNIDELTANLQQKLLSPPDGPYALFGHSMGALVAYELTARLVAADVPPPLCLVVSGVRAPSRPYLEPALRHLDDGALLAHFGTLGGIPDEVLAYPDLVGMLLAALRADLALLAGDRRPDLVLPVPITALGGADDPLVPSGSLDDWRSHTSARFRRRVFPGDHFFLQTEPLGVMAEIAQSVRAARLQQPGF